MLTKLGMHPETFGTMTHPSDGYWVPLCVLHKVPCRSVILTFIDDLRSVLYGTISVILLSKYCVPLFFNMFVPIRS